MAASIALGRGGKGIVCRITSEKEAVTASSRWGLFYHPGAGRRPIADGITSSRHLHDERASHHDDNRDK
jgi:hypothetical protein